MYESRYLLRCCPHYEMVAFKRIRLGEQNQVNRFDKPIIIKAVVGRQIEIASDRSVSIKLLFPSSFLGFHVVSVAVCQHDDERFLVYGKQLVKGI